VAQRKTFRRGRRALALVQATFFMTGVVSAVAAEETAPDPTRDTPTTESGANQRPAGETSSATEGDRLSEKILSFGIDEIVVTASPLARTAAELSRPVTVLSGPELLLKQQPTIGETLAHEPGVSSSYFGPGASRPIIRGQAAAESACWREAWAWATRRRRARITPLAPMP